ncbi:hypothetical protein [Mucilaginibacter sp. CSA2-8R]|uniref:hypothetical protein n=1 Tax=Mucilaginibacter sp. CSA2-8R TaxID=3141542 RepID=UPI00315DDFDC
MKTLTKAQLIYRTKLCILFIIAGLAISGITAFPIESELAYFNNHLNSFPALLQPWLHTVYNGLRQTNLNYPFLSYGTDWLAFAHLMLAILFIGPLLNPVKNSWVIQFGLIACLLIIPLAFIAGPIRHIPFFWQLIDCSFGVVAAVPLGIAYFNIRRLEQRQFN